MFYCNLIRYVLAVRGLHASRVGPDAQAGSWVEPSRPLCPINSFPKPGFPSRLSRTHCAALQIMAWGCRRLAGLKGDT